MNPSTINTLFGTSANTAGSSKSAPSTSAIPFGDVLMREMNERQAPALSIQPAAPDVVKAAPPPQTRKNNADQSPAPVKQVEKQVEKQTDKAAPREDEASASTSSAEQSTDAKSVADAKSAKTRKTTEESSETGDEMQGTGVSSASAELMALVNSLVQKPSVAAVDTVGAVDGDETKVIDGKAISGKGGVALLKEAGDAKADDRAAADLLTKVTGLNLKPLADGETAAKLVTESSAKPSEVGLNPAAGLDKKTFHETGVQSAPLNDTGIDAAAGRGKENSATGRLEVSGMDFRKVPEEVTVNTVKGDRQVEATSGVNLAAAGTTLVTSNVATRQAAGIPTDTLTPKVGTTAWDNALGQKVVWMAAGAQQSATITLNPPDLGPLQVVINVSNAKADAMFTSAQPEVRLALEAAMPRLKEMLNDAGISLGQASVNAGSSNQQGAANQGQSQPGMRGSQLGRADDQHDKESTPIVQGRNRATSGGDGMVDTFA